MEKYFNFNNSMPNDIRDYFKVTFSLYKISEGYKLIYRKDPDSFIARNLIHLYYKYIDTNYSNMIYTFKRKYIANEILVEKNDTPDQRKGVVDAYYYIQYFNEPIEKFSILTEMLKINGMIWRYRDEKFVEDLENDKKVAFELLENAKKNKSMDDYKTAKQMLKDIEIRKNGVRIGGHFRTNAEDVQLHNVEFVVPSGSESIKFANSLENPEKKHELLEKFNDPDILNYIEYCVKLTTDLIKYQPFKDGNKRTFRTVLNLLFKMRNIPPVYIVRSERDEYKKALFDAILNGDYRAIVGFYLFKICDSIYELDIKPYLTANQKCKESEDSLTEEEYIRKYKFRSLENLQSIFKYGELPKTCEGEVIKEIIPHSNPIYAVFKETTSDDRVIYCENNKTLDLRISGDDRIFTIAQKGNELWYYVDEESVLDVEFDTKLRPMFYDDDKFLIIKK